MFSFQVELSFDRGEDFTMNTVKVSAIADRDSYIAFSAVPSDLYHAGMSEGLDENEVHRRKNLRPNTSTHNLYIVLISL